MPSWISKKTIRGLRLREHQSSRLSSTLTDAYRPQLDIWMLRLLLVEQLDPADLAQDQVLKTLGLSRLRNYNLGRPPAARAFTRQLDELESRPLHKGSVLHRNLDRLASFLQLTKAEREVLTFSVLLQSQRPLAACAEAVKVESLANTIDVLAQVLDLEREDVRWALRSDGVLFSAGLLRGMKHLGDDTLWDKLHILDGLETALLVEHEDLQTMFQSYFRLAQAPRLNLDDFPYLQEEILLLRGLVQGARRQASKGVNILLHGQPGTGKTEFVRALANACNAPLYEVSFEEGGERGGPPAEDKLRFRAYRLSQRLLGHNRDCLILFDEIEDVFPDTTRFFFEQDEHSGERKAWTNHILETNPIPAFWLSNRIQQIDPSFLRRFDYTLELRMPPRSVRRGILQKYLGTLPVTSEWMGSLAACEDLTPALIEQVSKVAHLLYLDTSQALERQLTGVIRNNLEAQGRFPSLSSPGQHQTTPYSVQFLNPSEVLEPVIAGLRQRPAGRLCFYGPPGSGKTAFAHHLAEQLDKPLIKKQASDLLSCWVGMTEANIATMFGQAKAENALLLLDEADSFLQDRRNAHRSWEVTQVNELLVQMEAFEGLFICATNLMDSLDPAVLRRFDFKIQFGYLTSAQAYSLFLQTVEHLAVQPLEGSAISLVRHRLEKLTHLTPGDFATVIRQARIRLGPWAAEHLLSALEAECRAKLKGNTRIEGFTG